MLERVEQNMGRKPEHVSADAGYFSAEAVTGPKVEGIELLLPPDRQKHSQINRVTGEAIHLPSAAAESPSQPSDPSAEPTAKTVAEAMRVKLRSAAGNAIYKMRKAVVEPVLDRSRRSVDCEGFHSVGGKKSRPNGRSSASRTIC